jgi:hypothetical protein
MSKCLRLSLIATMALLVSSIAGAANGPLLQPIHVKMLYIDGTNGGGNIVVGFDTGSMPGCYGDSVGYLLTSNSRFKELHAQLLTMIAMGGIKGYVLYTVTGPPGAWSTCTFDGFEFVP